MEPRFPTPSELSEEQKLLFTMAGMVAPPGTEYERDGQLLGPFAPFLYTPTLIDGYWNWVKLGITLDMLGKRDTKICIHAVLSTYNPPHPFILKAHRQSSIDLGLTEQQLEDMLAGKTPKDFDEEEQTVCDFALALAKTRGPVDGQLFDRASKLLGKPRVAALVHMVIGYFQGSILAWAADPNPEGTA